MIRELVARAVSEPSQLMRIIGEPKRAGIETIHTADEGAFEEANARVGVESRQA